MYLLSHMSSRNQFGKWLNELGLTGRAVEIGTHRGDFARIFLNNWQGQELRCIDPWADYDPVQQRSLWGGAKSREEDYQAAQQVAARFPGRMRLERNTSRNAAAITPDESVDFIYVDGDHSFAAVHEDLCLWYPKLRTGGILAGHDWMCPGEVNGGWGANVQAATNEFAQLGAQIFLIVEEGGLPWSFYLRK